MTSLCLKHHGTIAWKAYPSRLPQQIALKAGQGFVVTLAIKILFGLTLRVAVLAGVIAALATLFEAVSRPLTKDLLRDWDHEIQITIDSLMTSEQAPKEEGSLKASSPQQEGNFLLTRIVQLIVPQLLAKSIVGLSFPSRSLAELALRGFAWMVLNRGFFHQNTAVAHII